MPRTLTLEILSDGPEDAGRRRPFHLAYGGRRFEGALQGSDALDADLAAWARLDASPEAEARLSDALRALLLTVWPRVELDLEAARAANEEARLDLVLNELELSGLPWELLQVEGLHLGLAHVPRLQLRYSLSNRPTLPLQPAACPVLMGWAGAVPRAEHERAIREVWGEAFDPAEHAVEADLSALNERLRALRPAVLLLLCHGGEDGGLLLRGPAGDPDLVSPKRLKEVLGQHALQLVVLCACASGDAPGLDALSSAARELHAVGVPAVLGSRLPLSARGSVVLVKRLSAALKAGLSVEAAVLAAREELRTRDQRSRDAEALQLYAAPGGDTLLRVEAPTAPVADPRPTAEDAEPATAVAASHSNRPKPLWLGLVALVLLGLAAWKLWPPPEVQAPDPVIPPPVLDPDLKVVIPSLERSPEVRVGRADPCGGAFGASVRIAQGSWILVGDPAALDGRGQVYTYDKNDVEEGRAFARYPVEAPSVISPVSAPLAGGPAGARVGADLTEFGNAQLFFAMGASEGGVPPFFDPIQVPQPPAWLGPALERALGGEVPVRASGWLSGNFGAFAMATAQRVVTLLFDGEGLRGQPFSFALERAFLAGFYQEPAAGDARAGAGLLASGYGGDCGAGQACTVLYSFTAARTVWPIGGGPVAVGDFDGSPGLDGAVFDVASSSVWILPDLVGKLGAVEIARPAAGEAAFRVPGLPAGALAKNPEALSLLSLGTLDGDATADLAVGVPFSKLDGSWYEGGVLVRLSEHPDALLALRLDNDRVYAAEPAQRAVSLSYDPDMGPGGTLAIGATGLFAPDAATSCGGVVVIEDPMRLLHP